MKAARAGYAGSTSPSRFSCLGGRWHRRGRHRRHHHLTPMGTLGAADGPSPSRKRPSDAPPRREYVVKQVSLLEARWRLRGCEHRHEHTTLMIMQGAADSSPTGRERPSDAPPRSDHVIKRVSRLEGRCHPRGRQCRQEHLTPMRMQGAADGPPPIRERETTRRATSQEIRSQIGFPP